MGKGYALITGASRGIGKAIAEECAQRGYHLALISLPNESLSSLAAEIASKYKVDTRFFETDLSAYDAADTVMDWVIEEAFPISMLVNNAGLGSVGPLIETNQDLHQVMLNLNMQTPYHLIRKLLPILKQQEKAYIINISSQAAFFPIPFKATYAATKVFLLNLSLALEYELRGTNIHVSAVCPSGVKTSPAIRKRIESAGFLSRQVALEPEEVAEISLRKTFRGKRFIVPGKLNTLSYWMSSMMPDFIRMGFISKAVKKNMAALEAEKAAAAKSEEKRDSVKTN